MRPRRWTELFFLDEATALSAGHRPCGECRYPDYQRFRALWENSFGAAASADVMDAKLHAERLEGKRKRTYRADIAALPDGTYVVLDGSAWLVWENALWEWSGDGYRNRVARPARREAEVLTPSSIVAILAVGYRPGIHRSALTEPSGSTAAL